MREKAKTIKNVDLWDKPYIKNNHKRYKLEKRKVNKTIRRISKNKIKEEI